MLLKTHLNIEKKNPSLLNFTRQGIRKNCVLKPLKFKMKINVKFPRYINENVIKCLPDVYIVLEFQHRLVNGVHYTRLKEYSYMSSQKFTSCFFLCYDDSNLYQLRKFTFVQIERECRRQIWYYFKHIFFFFFFFFFLSGRKYCGKMRKCLLPAFFSLRHNVFKKAFS